MQICITSYQIAVPFLNGESYMNVDYIDYYMILKITIISMNVFFLILDIKYVDISFIQLCKSTSMCLNDKHIFLFRLAYVDIMCFIMFYYHISLSNSFMQFWRMHQWIFLKIRFILLFKHNNELIRFRERSLMGIIFIRLGKMKAVSPISCPIHPPQLPPCHSRTSPDFLLCCLTAARGLCPSKVMLLRGSRWKDVVGRTVSELNKSVMDLSEMQL